MSIEKYIEKIKNIEEILLEFLDTEANTEEYFLNLTKIIDKNKICSDKHELALFLHIISKLSKNRHRYHNFISNLEKFLRYYSNDIQKKLTNSEIFKIFKGSKRILLFLFEEKIITLDKYIIQQLISYKFRKAKYPQYFSPEIKPFMNEDWFPKYKQNENEWIKELDIQIQDDFYELRKEGENENYICKLIRNDSIKEFIVYVNTKNYSLQSTIAPSIYETNSFLVKNQIESGRNDGNQLTLINYAAFFGSFKF